jgi:hypothetical protein
VPLQAMACTKAWIGCPAPWAARGSVKGLFLDFSSKCMQTRPSGGNRLLQILLPLRIVIFCIAQRYQFHNSECGGIAAQHD